ncbi:MAG: hypothetical protein KAV82_01180 [Phycisphaerae bacterium]|nr:hypothetical protein [Phycisphaerae bacterium]
MRLGNLSVRVWSFAVVVLMVVVCGAAAEELWVSAGPGGAATITTTSSTAAPQVLVGRSDSGGFAGSVEVPGFGIAAKKTPGGEFLELGWPDASIAGAVGEPALPVVRRLFVVPHDAVVTLHYREGESTVLDLADAGLPDVMPVQLPIEKLPGARERAVFQYDDAAYSVASVPSERAVCEEVGIVRGQRLFLLEVRPLEYNPVAQTLTYWPELQVEVQFEGGREPEVLLTPFPGLRKVVLNPDQISDVSRRGSGNYLIVVASTFETGIAAFADAKSAQGFDVTTWVPSSSSSTAIKSHIQGLWDAGQALDYILLVGDTNTISHCVGGGTGSPDTDLPYVCMDGSTDWHPDIAIGRFPVRTAAQLQAMVDKTLYYENGPLADPDYLKRAVFMASTDNYTVSEGTHNWVIENHMDPNGFVSDKLYTMTYGATTQDTRNSFNDGRFFGIYSGHGGTSSWADGPPFSQSDVNGLTNQNMYAFVMSYACVTGSYTADECFVETWVRAAGKGAVAMYGSSVNSYWTEDDVLEKRHFDAIFDAEDDVPAELGPVWNDTLMRYLAEMGTGSTTRRYFEMYNLMGDPSLRFPGACSDAGTVVLDKSKYACMSTAIITVGDCGLNLDDNVVEYVTVSVDSTTETGVEQVTLTETDASSAQFDGWIDISTTDAAGVLWVTAGDTITVTYIDADDGAGNTDVVVTTTAVVDCTPPVISNVHAIDVQPRRATITFDADEPVRGVVHYGPSCDNLPEIVVGSTYAASPMVSVTGLQDNTTYYYTVDAKDEAGNGVSDDNGGNCYMFSTPEVPDFFTELFGDGEGAFDLADKSLIFSPNGSTDFYDGCVEEDITSLPTDPAGGTSFSMSDDDYETVTLSGGALVWLYGTSYSTFYPCSNGYITFVHGETGYTESLEAHFAGIPQISALFDDLNPSTGGSVSWKQLDDRAVVTWENVPEYSDGGSNTFQVEMFFNGDIVISYLSVSSADSLVGLSKGTGLDPDYYESDLSGMGNCGPKPPQAFDGSESTPVYIPIIVTLQATDDGLPDPPAALDYIILKRPDHGVLTDIEDGSTITTVPYTLANHGNTVEYTPYPCYNGEDNLWFKVNDGGVPEDGGDSNPASVTFSVTVSEGSAQVVHDFPLDTDPGWSTDGLWGFGAPLGGGSHAGDPASAYTGSNIYGYNLYGDYSHNMIEIMHLTTTALDCSNQLGTELQFQRWLAVEAGVFDHVSVGVSNDGSKWTTVWDNSTKETISETSWSLHSYDISQVADGEETVYIRWGMGPTDGGTRYPGWNIDDVTISAVRVPPCDFNGDNTVDLFDFTILTACFSGPDGEMPPGCDCADLDNDDDVDLADFSVFQKELPAS